MTATGHALVGVLIAGKFNNPALVVPISFASHYICDLLPHWDSGTYWRKKSQIRFFLEAAVDVVVSIILSYFVFRYLLGNTNYTLMFLAIFAAQLPDWLSAPYLFMHIKVPFTTAFYKFGSRLNNKLDKPWGIVTQVALVVLLYVFLYKVF